MKTKNKMIVMVEIAIVLCSLFLVALPAIVAEQNQEMHEMSASTIATASEDDYVLGIYGNANEDDTIDMRDLTYVKLIFFGKKPETELADAKYDGKINPLDFIQIKLIIVGKERELTLIDGTGEHVTVSMPIKKIIALNRNCASAIRIMGAKDRIVGVSGGEGSESITASHRFFPDLCKKPSIGTWTSPDIEQIVTLTPDTVFTYATVGPSTEKLEDKLVSTDITVVRLDLYKTSTIRKDMNKLGYLLMEEENARKYLEWYDKCVDVIDEGVSGISENEKPRVMLMSRITTTTCNLYSTTHRFNELCERAGGKNLAADLEGTNPIVETEWVVEQNPEVIVRQSYGSGYETDDESKMKAQYDEITEFIGFRNLAAVKNNSVHVIQFDTASGPGYLVGFLYMAKWFHPDLFEDLNPQAIHQEYIDKFCSIDYDVSEHGVFVYLPLES